MPTPDSFLLENGGELNTTWFVSYDLMTLISVWLDRAQTVLGIVDPEDATAEQIAVITAYVYAMAYRLLVFHHRSRGATSISVGGISVSKNPDSYQWYLDLYNPWARLTKGLLEPISSGHVLGGAVLTEVKSYETY